MRCLLEITFNYWVEVILPENYCKESIIELN